MPFTMSSSGRRELLLTGRGRICASTTARRFLAGGVVGEESARSSRGRQIRSTSARQASICRAFLKHSYEPRSVSVLQLDVDFGALTIAGKPPGGG